MRGGPSRRRRRPATPETVPQIPDVPPKLLVGHPLELQLTVLLRPLEAPPEQVAVRRVGPPVDELAMPPEDGGWPHVVGQRACTVDHLLEHAWNVNTHPKEHAGQQGTIAKYPAHLAIPAVR